MDILTKKSMYNLHMFNLISMIYVLNLNFIFWWINSCWYNITFLFNNKSYHESLNRLPSPTNNLMIKYTNTIVNYSRQKLFKNFIINYFYKLKSKFKFNNFIKLLLNKSQFSIISQKFINLKNKLIPSYVNFFRYYRFFQLYNKNIIKNWIFLTGYTLSTFSWNFINPKKWLKKTYFFNFNKNFYKNNTIIKINKIPTVNLQIKKLLITDFLYNNDVAFYDLNYLIKVKSNINTPNDKWLFNKPYRFLNNLINHKSITNTNPFCLRLFFNLSKTYNILKKSFILKKKLASSVLIFKYSYSSHFLFPKYKTPSFNLIKIQSIFNKFLIKPYNTLPFSQIQYNFKKNKQFKFINYLKILSRFIKKSQLVKNNKLIKKIFKSQSNDSFSINKLFYKKNIKLNKVLLIYIKVFNNLQFKNRENLQFNWKLKTIKPSFILYFLTYLNKTFIKLINLKKNTITFTFENKFLYKISKNNLRIENSFIFNTYKPLIITSKEKNNFLSYKYGFLFLTNPSLLSFNNSKLINDLKKNLYSFSYKNEMQRHILRRYVKINSSLSLISDFCNNNITFDNIHDYFLSNSINYKNLIDRVNSLNYFSSETNTRGFLIKNIFNWTNIEEKNKDEYNFNLKRIRFKPGYMKIWREAREVLKLSLNINFKYQHKLTKYLFKFNKFTKFKTFIIQELSLLNTLNKSKLIPDNNTILLFIKNNLIYLNGKPCNNIHLCLVINDFIQLIVTYKYYIMFKWVLNWNIKKKIKLKNTSWKKLHTQIDYEEKQKSHTLPKWILNNRYLIGDIPNYLEADFFTLSFFLIYEPFLWIDINSYNTHGTRFGIINLYNWKYIN